MKKLGKKEIMERLDSFITEDFECDHISVTFPNDNMVRIELTNDSEKEQDGKTCANCSMCKTRMAKGTGCYYKRCKKHNMWVRHGFYCSDWKKDGDGDAD